MNDKRLIDANAFLNSWHDWLHDDSDKRLFTHLIEDAHTIDAVEVVRCKDCKYRGYDDCPMCHDEYYYDEDDGGDWVTRDMTVDDGFCHRGAKMDGGAEC